MPSKAHPGQQASWGLKIAAIGTLLFLHVPIWIIFLYTLTPDETTYTFPLPGITFQWFGVALQRADLWRALSLSLQVAAIATLIALVLGTLAAAAVYRSKFFGREAISRGHWVPGPFARRRAGGGTASGSGTCPGGPCWCCARSRIRDRSRARAACCGPASRHRPAK